MNIPVILAATGVYEPDPVDHEMLKDEIVNITVAGRDTVSVILSHGILR